MSSFIDKFSSVIGLDKLILSAMGAAIMAILLIGTKSYIKKSLGIDEIQHTIEDNRIVICTLLNIIANKEKGDIRVYDAQEEVNQILQIQVEKLVRNRNNKASDSVDLFNSINELKKHYNCN